MNASVYIDVLDKIFRMKNDYMSEPGDVNDQTDGRMIIDQDEEQSETSTFMFDASANSTSIIGSCFNNDDGEDEGDKQDDDGMVEEQEGDGQNNDGLDEDQEGDGQDDDEVSENREDDCENNGDDGNCDNDGDADDNVIGISKDGFVGNDVQSALPNVKEISAAIALFRHRHHLTKSCINDLCDMLRLFGVKNVPADFRSIEGNLTQGQSNIFQSKKHFVCLNCGYKGTDFSKCQNENCESKTGFVSNPTTLCTFRLLPQITSILERHNVMLETNAHMNSNIIDVQDGQARRHIVMEERTHDPNKKIVTFLLNSDGIVIKKFTRSIWITCMVINELPRKIRFNTSNVVICCISMGDNKPKKNQFQSLIRDWIQELKQLEFGFFISPPNLNGNLVKVYGYLIAASLDKPAQALLMNINDPTGFYSCVHCTIKGELLYLSSPMRK